MASQLLRYPAILRSAIATAVSRTGLTDVSDASRFKRFLAAVADQFDQYYYELLQVSRARNLDTAVGEDLDGLVAELQPTGLTRINGIRAQGLLVFSRRAATSGAIVIPTGTTVRSRGGITFRTTRTGIIAASATDSTPVPAQAIDPGEAGNVVVGAVNRIQGQVTGVDSVTNSSAFIGGLNRETDDQLRARAKNYLVSLARCGYLAIEYAAIGVVSGSKQVQYAKAVPNLDRNGDVLLYIDDGIGTAEETDPVTAAAVGTASTDGVEFLRLAQYPVRLESPYEIRVNGTARVNDSTVFLSPTDGWIRFDPPLESGDVVTADYVKYIGLIQEVQSVITGIEGDPDFPGWGAAGVRIRVLAPMVLVPSIAGTVSVAATADHAATIEAAQDATIRLLNGNGLGRDVVLAKIIDAVMEVEGVEDFTITSPTENIVVADNEIVRVTTSNVDFD